MRKCHKTILIQDDGDAAEQYAEVIKSQQKISSIQPTEKCKNKKCLN